MRTIDAHKVNRCNESLTIEALDEAGPGGANHHYLITGYHSKGNPSADASTRDETSTHLLFQNGPILEAGVNGVTNEALLAIVLDRLEKFQEGDYRCRENALAITKLEEAMHWLNHRTRQREARGVEGTHKV